MVAMVVMMAVVILVTTEIMMVAIVVMMAMVTLVTTEMVAAMVMVLRMCWWLWQ